MRENPIVVDIHIQHEVRSLGPTFSHDDFGGKKEMKQGAYLGVKRWQLRIMRMRTLDIGRKTNASEPMYIYLVYTRIIPVIGKWKKRKPMVIKNTAEQTF